MSDVFDAYNRETGSKVAITDDDDIDNDEWSNNMSCFMVSEASAES